MTHYSEEYKRRIHSFQKSISAMQLPLMVIGIGIFALGVISRPILRITKTEFIPLVRWIVDLMVSAGLIQFVAASYDIFSSCWKLMWPLYLAIGGTGLTILLELVAIGSSLFFYTQSLAMVNEEVVHPWYWVECLKESNCEVRMMEYINWFVIPQMVMAAVSVLLQCATVFVLSRMVKLVVNHHRVLHEAGEKYHDEWEEQQFNVKQEKSIAQPGTSRDVETNSAEMDIGEEEEEDDPDDTTRTPRRVAFSDTEMSPMGSARKRTRGGGENMEMGNMRQTYNAQIHVQVATPVTPRSILKGDHGYVAGSRVSLDLDDC